MASVAVTLFDAEEGLLAFLDTAELVTSADEAAFLLDFQEALTTAADKRDRVAARIAQLEAQQAFAAAEIKRLQAFKRSKEGEQERLEGYVSYVIQRLGKDAKDKWRKLQGHTSSLFLRACAPSVEITDEAAIPLDFKRAQIHMSAHMWDGILGVLCECTPRFYQEVHGAVANDTAITVDKVAIKATIQAGEDVPGAKLVTDKTTVGRK
jgi:hypothetical protein